MSEEMVLKPIEKIATDFIPQKYAPEGIDDPYYHHDEAGCKKNLRNLNAEEMEILVKNNNYAEDWNNIFVSGDFDPSLVNNCAFFGKVTIGALTHKYLEYHDLKLPVGLYNSTVFSCDIGDNVVIKNVSYLSHYRICDNCILFNISEMITTDHSKFGNGYIKEGEEESVRVWVEICNENEGRRVLPFESMIPADAYIWSKYRGDQKLMNALKDMTQKSFDNRRGFYGEVGKKSVIKNCQIIKDVKVGECAYIKGANKLKNLTILSSAEEAAQIGEGVEMVNGIVGYGSKIFYGSKAVRFVTGRNTQLKYGARLINSILGDNSTVSCCELLNNLIFPFHEQHHNNSFLIATTVLGQSNIAAGATIGSNHNSRSPDGEIVAGRGFWPGLCTDLKHNCRFASFTLIAKGSYSYEMDIPYPFGLVYNEINDKRVHIMPGYWFMYDMYAVARNTWKFQKRDKRKVKVQNIELEYLAPDTVSEMLAAMRRIEYLFGSRAAGGKNNNFDELADAGKKALTDGKAEDTDLEDPDVMKKYGGVVVKPARGWKTYHDFCIYFAVKNIISFLGCTLDTGFETLRKGVEDLYKQKLYHKWENLGGQMAPKEQVSELTADITSGKLESWEKVHQRYNELWAKYPGQKARYGLYVIEEVTGKKISGLNKDGWKALFASASDTMQNISGSSLSSRQKDYDDKFRKMMYDDDNEMTAVLGDIRDNSFLQDLKKDTETGIAVLKSLGR